MDSISYTCRQAPRYVTYGHSLRGNNEAYLVLKHGVFVLSDCNENGKLTKKYVIIEVKYNEERTIVEYLCSCKQSNYLHVTELKILEMPKSCYELYTCKGFQ